MFFSAAIFFKMISQSFELGSHPFRLDGQSAFFEVQKRSTGNRPLSRDEDTGSMYSIYSNGDIVEGSIYDDKSSIPIVFTIRRSGSLAYPGEVQFRLKSGSAKIGTDVEGTKNFQTIQFPALEITDNGSALPLFQEQTIEVFVTDDDRSEYDEFFFGQLRQSQSVDQLATSMAKAFILNDDFKSHYSLSAVNSEVKEGDSFNITVTRTVADKPSSVELFLKGNTADIGVDVKDIGIISLNFLQGETEATFELPTFVDSEVEGDEALFARIDTISKLDQISTGNIKLKILDTNQPSNYSFLNTTPVTEGENVSFVVQRTSNGLDNSFDSDGAFYFWTKKKTAKSNDFQMFNRNKYVIPKNQSTLAIDVGTFDDDEVESDESIIGFIRPYYKADSTSDSSETAIINDNDFATIYSMDIVDEENRSVSQNEFDEGTTARFRVTRSTDLGAGSVKLKIRGTTAKADKDFERPISPIVEFADGVDEQYVDVFLSDNDRVESKESFFASLQTVNRVDKVSGGRQRINIIDDDSNTVFDLSVLQSSSGLDAGKVDEGETSIFRITRSGGDLLKSSKVQFRTNPGNASKEDDYISRKKQIVEFPSNVEYVDIPVQTIQDFLIEKNEKFYASIKPLNRYDEVTNRKQSVTILDDDKSAEFSLEPQSQRVDEGKNFTINISRSGGEGRVSSAIVWTTNGDAKSGKDYEKLSKLQVDFFPEETGPKTLTLPTFVDDDSDVGESFYLNIRPLNNLDVVDEFRLMLTIN